MKVFSGWNQSPTFYSKIVSLDLKTLCSLFTDPSLNEDMLDYLETADE